MKPKTVKLATFIENPDNPQTVTDDAFALLVDSLRNTPETLAVSKIAYVTDYVALDGTDLRGQRVVIAGNKRLRALKQIASHGGLASADGEAWHVTPRGDVPADWFYDLTPLGKEAREAWLVKSNIQSGEWDAEKLLALYPQEDLAALMGDDAIAELLRSVSEASAESPDNYGTSFTLPSGEKSPFGCMNFVVTEAQRQEINRAISTAPYCDGFDCADNTNRNGASLFLIVKDWLSSKIKEEPPFDEVARRFKGLRESLCAALKASGRKASEVDKLLGTSGMAGHYFNESQFMFPTREAFEKMRTILPLTMDYEESKLIERQYRRAEMLRRKPTEAMEGEV